MNCEAIDQPSRTRQTSRRAGRNAASSLRLAAAAVILLLLLLPGVRARAQDSTEQPAAYVVQEGDTLYSIAQRFGTTVDEIAAANGIADPAQIAAGQTLIIPTEPAVPEPAEGTGVYVVQEGDTLSAIAARYGTTAEALASANGILDPAAIVAGQRLVIPAAGAPGPAQPTAADEADRHRVRLHTVQAGETLPYLAFRYGSTVAGLRVANGLQGVGLVVPGREIRIPAATAPTRSTPTFPTLRWAPDPVVQGQTLLLRLAGQADYLVDGVLLDTDLEFFPDGTGGYWSIVGVDALSAPGSYPLTLWARELTTGDLLTLEAQIGVAAGNFSVYNVQVPADRQSLLDPALTQSERDLVGRVVAEVSEPQQWSGLFLLPLEGDAVTTAPFGQRRSYAGGPVSSYHSGLDYRAAAGTPIHAPAAGVVALAEPLQVRGQAVILDHGLGVFSGFWHLSRIDVQVGQAVAAGDVLGLVGNTGLSTGSHLHWEIRVRGVAVDPEQWVEQVFP